MNPNQPKDRPEQSMEGRQFTPEGTDIGDRNFHETHLNDPSGQESLRIKLVEQFEREDRARFAQQLEMMNPAASIKLYKDLCQEVGEQDPHFTEWQERIRALEK